MQRQGSLVTRWPRLKNSAHAQSVEVIVGVVMGQKVVRPKLDRPYRLLRLWLYIVLTFFTDWKDILVNCIQVRFVLFIIIQCK